MPEFLNPFTGMIPGRKLTHSELVRGIRLSLSAEEEASHLYTALADATDDELAKVVLRDIADEERVHKGEFQRLLTLLLDDEQARMDEGAAEVNEIAGRLSGGAGSSSREPVPSVGGMREVPSGEGKQS